MLKSLRPSSVIPPGFAIASSSICEDEATILVHSRSSISRCPTCGTASRRVHSHTTGVRWQICHWRAVP